MNLKQGSLVPKVQGLTEPLMIGRYKSSGPVIGADTVQGTRRLAAKLADLARSRSYMSTGRAQEASSTSGVKHLLFKGFKQPYIRGEEQTLLPLTGSQKCGIVFLHLLEALFVGAILFGALCSQNVPSAIYLVVGVVLAV